MAIMYSKEQIKKDLIEIFKNGAGDLIKEGTKSYGMIEEILDELAESKYNLNLAREEDNGDSIAIYKEEIESLSVSLKVRTALIKTEIGTKAGSIALAVLKTLAKILISTLI